MILLLIIYYKEKTMKHPNLSINDTAIDLSIGITLTNESFDVKVSPMLFLDEVRETSLIDVQGTFDIVFLMMFIQGKGYRRIGKIANKPAFHYSLQVKASEDGDTACINLNAAASPEGVHEWKRIIVYDINTCRPASNIGLLDITAYGSLISVNKKGTMVVCSKGTVLTVFSRILGKKEWSVASIDVGYKISSTVIDGYNTISITDTKTWTRRHYRYYKSDNTIREKMINNQ